MTSCRKHNINNQCTTTELDNIASKVCDPFEFCLPFGKQVIFNGECIRVEDNSTIADGEYGVIVVENGCIIDARPNPAFEYTPPPCTPAAGSCNDAEAENALVVQPGICNMISVDTAGRIGAYINAVAGSGIILDGCGTDSSPLVITAIEAEAARTYLISGSPSILPVDGNGLIADPYVVSHAETDIGPGVYGEFTTDAWGHVIGFDENTSILRNIVAGPGISVNQVGTVATISLRDSDAEAGEYLLGGYTVTTDLSGRITAIRQSIGLDEDIYDLHNYNVTVNALGSITALTPITRTVDTHFSTFFSGNRDSTSMTINTTVAGQLRITYRGDLGDYGSSPPNLINLPSMYQVTVNGVIVQAFARIISGGVAEIHALPIALYGVGSHTISINNTSTIPDGEFAFSDIGFMDIQLTALGE